MKVEKVTRVESMTLSVTEEEAEVLAGALLLVDWARDKGPMAQDLYDDLRSAGIDDGNTNLYLDHALLDDDE